jgi:hypothetical protein
VEEVVAKPQTPRQFANRIVTALANPKIKPFRALWATTDQSQAAMAAIVEHCPERELSAGEIKDALDENMRWLEPDSVRKYFSECRKLSNFVDAKIVSIDEPKTPCNDPYFSAMYIQVESVGIMRAVAVVPLPHKRQAAEYIPLTIQGKLNIQEQALRVGGSDIDVSDRRSDLTLTCILVAYCDATAIHVLLRERRYTQKRA